MRRLLLSSLPRLSALWLPTLWLPALFLSVSVAAQSTGPDSLAARYDTVSAEADSLYRAAQYAESADRYAKAFSYVREPERGALYYAASAAARDGQVGRAFGFLHRAVEAGWVNTDHLDAVAHFAALRAYPDLWIEVHAAVERTVARRHGETYDADLAARLRRVYTIDQDVRRAWRRVRDAHEGPVPDSVRTAFEAVYDKVDAANVAVIDSVVAARGWPRLSVVGEMGSLTAFIVVQHAGDDVQAQYFPTLEAAVLAGDAEPWHLAYLTDRMLWRRDEPQRYGSQFNTDPETGVRTHEPLEAADLVNERRAAIGMSPLDGFPPARDEQ